MIGRLIRRLTEPRHPYARDDELMRAHMAMAAEERFWRHHADRLGEREYLQRFGRSPLGIRISMRNETWGAHDFINTSMLIQMIEASPVAMMIVGGAARP